MRVIFEIGRAAAREKLARDGGVVLLFPFRLLLILRQTGFKLPAVVDFIDRKPLLG